MCLQFTLFKRKHSKWQKVLKNLSLCKIWLGWSIHIAHAGTCGDRRTLVNQAFCLHQFISIFTFHQFIYIFHQFILCTQQLLVMVEALSIKLFTSISQEDWQVPACVLWWIINYKLSKKGLHITFCPSFYRAFYTALPAGNFDCPVSSMYTQYPPLWWLSATLDFGHKEWLLRIEILDDI